jgi:hypothetical protein
LNNCHDQQVHIVVSVKYGELSEVIDWCSDHCKKDWELAEIEEFGGSANGIYHFTFIDERDALTFSLRWV